jgi:hypothetical protein
MKLRTSLRAALEDPALLGNALPGGSWRAWRIILIAAMGETGARWRGKLIVEILSAGGYSHGKKIPFRFSDRSRLTEQS